MQLVPVNAPVAVTLQPPGTVGQVVAALAAVHAAPERLHVPGPAVHFPSLLLAFVQMVPGLPEVALHVPLIVHWLSPVQDLVGWLLQ